MLQWLIGIILGEIICESSNWQHIQRLKITILEVQICNFLDWKGLPNVNSLICLYTQNIKFYCMICNENKEIYVANLMIQ